MRISAAVMAASRLAVDQIAGVREEGGRIAIEPIRKRARDARRRHHLSQHARRGWLAGKGEVAC